MRFAWLTDYDWGAPVPEESVAVPPLLFRLEDDVLAISFDLF